MKVAIVSVGYVGLSIGMLRSQKNGMALLNISKQRTQLRQNRIPPVEGAYIEGCLTNKPLPFPVTLSAYKAYQGVDKPANDITIDKYWLRKIFKRNKNGSEIYK